MTVESELLKYGYAALALGTFLEGETILVIAGFLAHRGYLSLSFVILAAFAGSFFGDQLYFQIGRRGGAAFLKKYPSMAEKAARFTGILERHSILAILSFRFLYGLRTVSPFVIGMSRVPAMKFFTLNMISAAIWAATVGTAGYFFGKAVEVLIRDVKHRELELILVLAAAGLLLFTVFYLRKKRKPSQEQKH
jgi:membrane protein DedA with SNARE-associated domain